MGFRRRITEAPRVDLTPMIDVVFLLLIFFMISTTFIEKPGLKITLPESTVLQLESDKRELSVYLAADGQIYLQRQSIAFVDLTEKLSAYGASAKQMVFVLMADKDVSHGQVIQLMDMAKSAGFGELAIATDRPASKVE